MFQMSLITSFLVWERILEIENEKRRLARYEDVFTSSSEDLARRLEEENMFANTADFIKPKLPTCDQCSQKVVA